MGNPEEFIPLDHLLPHSRLADMHVRHNKKQFDEKTLCSCKASFSSLYRCTVAQQRSSFFGRAACLDSAFREERKTLYSTTWLHCRRQHHRDSCTCKADYTDTRCEAARPQQLDPAASPFFTDAANVRSAEGRISAFVCFRATSPGLLVQISAAMIGAKAHGEIID